MGEEFRGIPEGEIEKPKEPAPVTGKELVEIVESNRFQGLLKKAAKGVQKTGYEAGFAVLKDAYEAYKPSEIFFTGLAKAEEESTALGELVRLRRRVLDEMESRGLTPICLIDLHFHPGVSGLRLITPSITEEGRGDLFNLSSHKLGYPESSSSRQKILVPPIAMIGQVDQEGDSLFLIYQEQFQQDLEEMPATVELLIEELKGVEDQEDVLKILRENNYQAEMIRVSSGGVISDEDKSKIEKYAYQPKIIGRWEEKYEE